VSELVPGAHIACRVDALIGRPQAIVNRDPLAARRHTGHLEPEIFHAFFGERPAAGARA